MKLFKLPLLACIITILAISCEKGPDTNSNGNTDEPVTESGEGYSVTYKYKDGVIVFDETSSHYVKEIISDTIVVFSHSIPDDLTPRVGDIISSRVYPEIPYGLGNRVLSIQKEGDGYRCVTTPAALEDIFSDLIINSEFALPLVDEDTKVSFSPVLTLDLNKEYKDHVKISGGVDLGVVFTCNVDLKARKFEISLNFSTELDCGVSVYAGLPDELKKWHPFPNKTIFRNVVEIGPVVLHPYLDFRPYLSFDLEGSVDIIEFQKKSSWTVGIKDGKAFQKKETDNGDISNIIKNFEIDAKGEIALNLPFIFGLGVYTKGIAVELKPTAAFAFGADCQLMNPNLFIEGPELSFEARIDTYAAAFVRIFGKEFFSEQEQLASLSLFKKEWPLLPRLVDETLNVIEFCDDESDPDDEETGADSLAFVANYALDPGLLCRFMDIEAGFGVYEEGNEVYHLFNETRIEPTQTNEYAYKLGKLKYNTKYYGCPSIRIGNTVYNGNGIEFKAQNLISKAIVTSGWINDSESTERTYFSFKYDNAGRLSSYEYYGEDVPLTFFEYTYDDEINIKGTRESSFLMDISIKMEKGRPIEMVVDNIGTSNDYTVEYLYSSNDSKHPYAYRYKGDDYDTLSWSDEGDILDNGFIYEYTNTDNKMNINILDLFSFIMPTIPDDYYVIWDRTVFSALTSTHLVSRNIQPYGDDHPGDYTFSYKIDEDGNVNEINIITPFKSYNDIFIEY